MTTPLQSPEYAALVAAKEARDAAYAKQEKVHQDYVGTSSYMRFGRDIGRVVVLAEAVERVRGEVIEADAVVTAAQAAFDAAYPAPVDVVAAVEAVKTASIAVWANREAFNKSLTPEQIALDAEMGNAQTALDAAVTHAKALIETAQVSPSKAFVVRSSTKMVTSEADIQNIYQAIKDGELPDELLSIDKKALEAWAKQEPDRAVTWGVSNQPSVSVAFYPNKL